MSRHDGSRFMPHPSVDSPTGDPAPVRALPTNEEFDQIAQILTDALQQVAVRGELNQAFRELANSGRLLRPLSRAARDTLKKMSMDRRGVTRIDNAKRR